MIETSSWEEEIRPFDFFNCSDIVLESRSIDSISKNLIPTSIVF